MSKLNVDLGLVHKYNVAGPRYTSYPPATKFTDTISWEQLSAKIEENNRTPRDLSVYFHIPFCETLCWFCGCTTVITTNHSKGKDYIDYLDREMSGMAPRLNPARKLVQLHFGGGSPTFLRPDEIRRLEAHIETCPTCPNLYRSLVAVTKALRRREATQSEP